MKIKLKRQDQDFHLLAQNEQGNEISIDASPEIGGHGKGMRPMQLLLSALGACSSIDVLLILKKQKVTLTHFEVEVESEREPIADYSLFKDIVVHFTAQGEVGLEKLERAIKLSLEKYCSVAKTLEPTAKISYKITLN